MRKLMCVMLSCMMLLGLTACGGEEEVKNAAVGTFEQTDPEVCDPDRGLY